MLNKKKTMAITAALALAAGGFCWYRSEVANMEHEASTIFEPPDDERRPYFFQNSRGMWLHYREWLPDTEPVALVFVVHGHGEHISRKGYHMLADKLTSQGLAVFGLDHAGHGRSNGSRGHVPDIQIVCTDFEQLVNIISPKFREETPRFAIGHSLGGNILTNTILRQPSMFSGVILSAPAVCTHIDPSIPEVLRKVGSLLVTVVPKMNSIRLPLDGLTRNPKAAEEYLSDPLNNKGWINLATGHAIVESSRAMWDLLPQITLPIFIIHGTADTIVHPSGSTQFYSRISSTDKDLSLAEEVKHEFWEDPDADRFYEAIVDWIKNRI